MPNTHRTGYEAAALLDRLMSGKTVPPVAHLIPPLGVAARQSTDVLAVEDRDGAHAVRLIREHACEGINVGDVLRAVPLSRRVLEQRFHRLLGRTPREEILNVRLARVKQLLAETDVPLYAIAERTGFEHVEYLSVVFRRETGGTPSAFRQAARGTDPAAKAARREEFLPTRLPVTGALVPGTGRERPPKAGSSSVKPY
jgi:LacI family transcriptional regulator